MRSRVRCVPRSSPSASRSILSSKERHVRVGAIVIAVLRTAFGPLCLSDGLLHARSHVLSFLRLLSKSDLLIEVTARSGAPRSRWVAVGIAMGLLALVEPHRLFLLPAVCLYASVWHDGPVRRSFIQGVTSIVLRVE